MPRYIKSSIALQKIDKAVNDYAHHDDVLQLFSDLRCAIIEAPTADVQEVKHGKFISELIKKEDWKGKMQQYYQPNSCSNCHEALRGTENYCPNCGAKMDGKD